MALAPKVTITDEPESLKAPAGSCLPLCVGVCVFVCVCVCDGKVTAQFEWTASTLPFEPSLSLNMFN